MKYFWSLCFLLGAVPARATNLTVSCQLPLKNTDGSSIAANATITANIYGGTTSTALNLLTPTPLATCLSVRSNVNSGQACYAATAVETIAGIASESAQTAPICVTVPPTAPTPGNPTVSLASTSTIVYMLVPGKDTYGAIIVGSAPIGTACDATKPVLTYYVIPTSAVTFTGSIKPPVVVANCQ